MTSACGNPGDRILHVLPGLQMGGAEIVAQRIMMHQAKAVHVDLATWIAGDEYELPGFREVITHSHLPVKPRGRFTLIHAVVALRRLIKKSRPAVVYSHLEGANLVTALATLGLHQRPVHIASHQSSSWRRNSRIYVEVISFFYRRLNLIACSTPAAKFLSKFNIRGRVETLPNPLGLPPHRGERPRLSPAVQLVAVGRIATIKNYPLMIRALAELPADYHLTVAGPGSPDSLIELAGVVGCQDRVKFVGRLDQDAVRALLLESDVFVMTSDSEGEPSALLEAAAIGLIVVGVDTQGLGEAVRKVGGVVVTRPHTPKAVAEGILAAATTFAQNEPDRSWVSEHDSDGASHRYCEFARRVKASATQTGT